jgi:hypothetical protein
MQFSYIINRTFEVTPVKKIQIKLTILAFFALAICGSAWAQKAANDKVDLGSNTAKNGFKNEDEIRDKFNNWKSDGDARAWLTAMNYKVVDIERLTTTKPHGEKADVEVQVKTRSGERTEGISIKLVSSPNGFNQIDKRWLSHYAAMWKMPQTVLNALKLFVGEIPPLKPGRSPDRMFLNEIDADSQKAITAFFTEHKADIVKDLFQGEGAHAAGWVMVANKATANTHWTLKPMDDVIKFYSDGPVAITSGGNLKIGRITVQRKGGDGGRETARMLQFKINPTLLISDVK